MCQIFIVYIKTIFYLLGAHLNHFVNLGIHTVISSQQKPRLRLVREDNTYISTSALTTDHMVEMAGSTNNSFHAHSLQVKWTTKMSNL